MAIPPIQAQTNLEDWTILIANDTCPDYTWGNNEAQTRGNFAELIRSHLDEMNRTDHEKAENRDHYNMTATIEALCFLERYPERRAELARRIKEGRICVSPFLCNTLLGFHSVEGMIRSLYPARRLEQEWGITVDIAEHIECPSLPWGVPSVLAGCGVRWLPIAFLDYDSTFAGLKNPPLFIYEGPDGSQIRVILDAWASRKAHYAQGNYLLQHLPAITNEWVPHYQQLGTNYPLKIVLASGTHSDTSPKSYQQTRGFAEGIMRYNAGPGPHPKLVNGTLTQFCQAADDAQAKTPFMPVVRGCFGHSWDLWPVSLAQYAADMRSGERACLAGEALVAVASAQQPSLGAMTRSIHERAEWCWAMLADHAWNGTDAANQKVNAELRRLWSEELHDQSRRMVAQAWRALGLKSDEHARVLFNSLGFARAGLVQLPAPPGINSASGQDRIWPSQIVEENTHRFLYFVTSPIPGFGLRQCQLLSQTNLTAAPPAMRATATELESPFYRLKVDRRNGGIASLIHQETGRELVSASAERSLCQTVYFDGRERTLTNVTSGIAANGPVLARLWIDGQVGDMQVGLVATLYAELDRVDFEVRINKPVATRQERICQMFPIAPAGAVLRVETPGAVIRPYAQPQGDLLPGADTKRFAVQGFVDASLPEGPGVTIAPLDSFVLRQDLDSVAIEALGNDQNYKEVTRDQHGVTQFRFRYVLRGHTNGYNQADTIAWSRSVATPLMVGAGSLPPECLRSPAFDLDPSRVMATCLKVAEGGAADGILRLWETGGKAGPIKIPIPGYRRAIRTDLLERDLEKLNIDASAVELYLRPYGFAAVRLGRIAE